MIVCWQIRELQAEQERYVDKLSSQNEEIVSLRSLLEESEASRSEMQENYKVGEHYQLRSNPSTQSKLFLYVLNLIP